jgi:hypothetical protein
MRFDGHDPIDPEPEEATHALAPAPLDAAESAWDPWLWALYLRELAENEPPKLH